MANTFRAQDAACTRCAFFDDHAAQAGTASAGSGEELGLCRFNPPVSQPSGEVHGLWPVVSGADWCGHYELGGAMAGLSAQPGLQAAAS